MRHKRPQLQATAHERGRFLYGEVPDWSSPRCQYRLLDDFGRSIRDWPGLN